MTACYADASAVLRYLLGQPGMLDLEQAADTVIASVLLEVECNRVLDRFRLSGTMTVSAVAQQRASLARLRERIVILDLDRRTLIRAASPLAAPLGTLDAIHLATALFWLEDNQPPLCFATHDRALARAAQLYGLEVLGLS
ncbi:MAG: type II toxin-antitoxin system VapC family toxin [Terriglobales bacterium]